MLKVKSKDSAIREVAALYVAALRETKEKNLWHLLTRAEKIANRLFSKALIKYFGNTSVPDLQIPDAMALLNRCTVEYRQSSTRLDKMYSSLVAGYKLIAPRNMTVGWSDPYTLLTYMLKDSVLIGRLISLEKVRTLVLKPVEIQDIPPLGFDLGLDEKGHRHLKDAMHIRRLLTHKPRNDVERKMFIIFVNVFKSRFLTDPIDAWLFNSIDFNKVNDNILTHSEHEIFTDFDALNVIRLLDDHTHELRRLATYQQTIGKCNVGLQLIQASLDSSSMEESINLLFKTRKEATKQALKSYSQLRHFAFHAKNFWQVGHK